MLNMHFFNCSNGDASIQLGRHTVEQNLEPITLYGGRGYSTIHPINFNMIKKRTHI